MKFGYRASHKGNGILALSRKFADNFWKRGGVLEARSRIGVHHPAVAVYSQSPHYCWVESGDDKWFRYWILPGKFGEDRCSFNQPIRVYGINEVIIERKGHRRKPMLSELSNDTR